MSRGRLHTVCDEARCPNRSECFSRGTATFLIMGDVCTRSCRYCSIAHGRPRPLDADEPARARARRRTMGLKHVVVTSVDRDDLPDGGAAHFAAVIAELKKLEPRPTVEVLTPDFRATWAAVDAVLDAGPDVYNHNVETVRRLYPAGPPRRGATMGARGDRPRRAHGARAWSPSPGSWSGSARPARSSRRRCGTSRRRAARWSRSASTCARPRRKSPVVRYWTPDGVRRARCVRPLARPRGDRRPVRALLVPRRGGVPEGLAGESRSDRTSRRERRLASATRRAFAGDYLSACGGRMTTRQPTRR